MSSLGSHILAAGTVWSQYRWKDVSWAISVSMETRMVASWKCCERYRDSLYRSSWLSGLDKCLARLNKHLARLTWDDSKAQLMAVAGDKWESSTLTLNFRHLPTRFFAESKFGWYKRSKLGRYIEGNCTVSAVFMQQQISRPTNGSHYVLISMANSIR